VSVGETLQVGRSATIGSGGLWVDTGEGINTSKLKIDLNNNDPLTIASLGSVKAGLTIQSRGWVTPTSSIASVAIGQSINFTEMDMQSTSLSVVVGSNIFVSDSVANNLTLSNLSIQNTDVDFGDAKGINLSVSNLQSTDVYGIDISFSGITTANPVKGLSITGEDTNTLSGDLEVGGDLSVGGVIINNTTRKIKEIHGSFLATYNSGLSGPATITFVNDYDGFAPTITYAGNGFVSSVYVGNGGGFIQFNLGGTWDPDKTTIQITPKYDFAGTAVSNHLKFSYTGTVNSSGLLTIYFLWIGTSPFVNISSIAASVSVIEQQY